MNKIACLAVMITFGSLAAFGDIPDPSKYPKSTPKPKPAPAVMTSMTIRLDREATEAKLIIPRSQIKELRAELEGIDGEGEGEDAATWAGASRVSTIVSGTFLSLAFIFGGIWFARSRQAPGKSFVILAALAGIASVASIVYANVGPPPEARSITGRMFSESMHRYKFGSGQVKVEASSTANEIVFVVPDPKPAE